MYAPEKVNAKKNTQKKQKPHNKNDSSTSTIID